MNEINQSAEIIEFKKELSFDDIKCELNSIQSCDLKQILLMTPEDRRLDVALAFSGITLNDLIVKSGLDTNGKTWKCWMYHTTRLPLGAALRLAKVFGVPVEILFESPKWRNEK